MVLDITAVGITAVAGLAIVVMGASAPVLGICFVLNAVRSKFQFL